VSDARPVVRPASGDDLQAINDIYNRYVLQAHYTFDLEPMPMEARREWFSQFAEHGRHRLLVAELGERVIGYACSTKLRPRPAYGTSIETTLYLATDAVGRGVGSRLYEALFASLGAEDLHRAYAVIALPNPASIALHERFGFRRSGLFSEQGRKFGRYWDVAWYEKPLGGPAGRRVP